MDSSEQLDSETSVQDAGVGLANPQLDHARRRTLDLVNRLHSTGVQVDIDLPQIAVIGSQSAGKSSLIESISGITLPRAAGTCTRCPTECRLSYSKKPWQCVVSLRFITDPKGQPLGQARNELFGPTILKKSEVEDRIRRAQRAILNPSKPRESFLQKEDYDAVETELSFSINCVSLQISGPDVADLSFCDLPGLIASVTKGNTDDIALVESLVVSYIKKPSCIILLTVACETDFENQGAHRLAKQFDPNGKRTIGVLTKPDRIPTGEESNWISFIMNMKEPLENGWYCVKQPGSSDIQKGITWQQARKREDEFFSMNAPWSELESTYQQFLRTSNLVERLSSVLSDLISKRLPEIQEELVRSVVKVESELRELPKEPSGDPLAEIMNLIHRFTIDVSKHAEGVPLPDGLLQIIRPAELTFRHSIKETAPEFMPFEKSSNKKIEPPSFLFNEDSYERRRHNSFVYYIDEVLDRAQKARTRELPGSYPFVVQEGYIKESIAHWRVPALKLGQAVYQIMIDHMKGLVGSHFSSFGQGLLEQRVRVLMQDHVKKCWERAEERIKWILEVEERPATLNTHYLSDYRDKFLTYYKAARAKDRNPFLHDQIAVHSSTFQAKPLFGSRQQEASPKVDMMFNLKVPQSTSSSSSGGTSSSSGGTLTTAAAPTGVAKVLQGLTELGVMNVSAVDIAKLLSPDPMEPALNIMADVRAYFQVAFKRFVDYIPSAIDVELVRGVEKDLLQTLYIGLGIHGKDGHQICRELAKEYPAMAHKREELKKKLERLNVAMRELMSVGQ